MRTLSKIAFSFLIWPIFVMAQEPLPFRQPDRPAQNAAGAENSAFSSDAPAVPSPTPIQIPVRGQTHPLLYVRPIRQPPNAAGYVPFFNVSAGYSVVNLGTPSAGRPALSGTNVSISAHASERLGAKLDLDYARAANVFGSARHMEVLSYLIGPVFYPWNGGLLNTYAHVLVGAARVAGPFKYTNGGWSAGYVHYPAWALGGGVEYPLSAAFAFRVNIDYLHTHFFNSSGAIRGQNSLRVVDSIVYYLGGRHPRRQY
jgi:hypothetical protein